jgi:hypothetical protein
LIGGVIAAGLGLLTGCPDPKFGCKPTEQRAADGTCFVPDAGVVAPDAGTPDAGPADVGIGGTAPPSVGQIGGGGLGATGRHRLRIVVGPATPTGQAATTRHRLTIGPGISR